jgi:hypothetical protein
MDPMLRKALRKYSGLRQQLENVLLGEEGDAWEAELKKFLAKRPCWVAERKPAKRDKTSVFFPQTGIDWLRVYRELGLEAEFVAALPGLNQTVGENLWWVSVITGVTPNKVVTWFRNRGANVYTHYGDLDDTVSTNDRDPANGSYVVCFRQTIEADSDLVDKSANMLTREGVKGITLLERLLLGMGYFLQTGDHLDKQNITLCSGSCYCGGGVGLVPSVDWRVDDCRLYVGACNPDGRAGHLRTRAVVSLPDGALAKAG